MITVESSNPLIHARTSKKRKKELMNKPNVRKVPPVKRSTQKSGRGR